MKAHGCWLLAVLLWAGLSFAQLVPLELDQTIALPDTSSVWDVMPQPDGGFVWVQASRLPNRMALIRWGNSASLEIDSFEVAECVPQRVVGFWEANYQPHAVIVSHFYTMTRVEVETVFDVDLRSHLRCGRVYEWTFDENNGRRIGDIGVPFVAPHPMPPEVSVSVTFAFGAEWMTRVDARTEDRGHYGAYVPDMLTSCAPIPMTEWRGVAAAAWAVEDDVLWTAWTGSRLQCGERFWSSEATLSGGFVIGRALSGLPRYVVTCSYRSPFGICQCSTLVMTTSDSGADRLLCFGIFNNELRGWGLSALGDSTHSWTVSGSYAWWIAAETVGGNSSEEFLAFDVARRLFDVLDAQTGQVIATTDTLFCAANSAPRVLARYDSTYRRLAFRVGHELRLYRFGEYLPATERPTPAPVEFALSAYPNPFNPSTEITFSLPRSGRIELTVYDLTGRRVQTLADRVVGAGEQCVTLDGTGLASGIYFVRLSGDFPLQTRKLVLLK